MSERGEEDVGGITFDNILHRWRNSFVRCLRHKACVENVRARRLVDDEAAVLALREMLKSTRTAEKKVQTENSVPLSINTISEEAINSEAGRSLIRDRVKAALSCLCEGERDVDDEDDESYSMCQLEENS
ncbi:unnamed protein product [Malus baccata var. baccata]